VLGRKRCQLLAGMPWHTGLPPEERKRPTEADVDHWWHLDSSEAVRRLEERSEE